MKKIIFLFILVVLSCGSPQNKFQTYDQHAWKAMLQYKNKDYQKSLSNFEDAFKIIPDENVTDYFYAAAAALHLKKSKVGKQLIIDAIIQTNASKDYFLRFEEFDPFRKNKLFEDIKTSYSDFTNQFFAQLDHPEIYKEIDSLLNEDQKVRGNDIGYQEQNRVDSLNITRLKEITKKYGWHSKGWLILWHQRMSFKKNNYVWTFFRPYIDQQIRKGNIRKDFWVMFEDQMAIFKEKKQIYGSYLWQLNKYPIKAIESVDDRRKKVGLPPLWYMEEVYDITLPDNYIYPKNLTL